jgi:Cu+-exporting ATPase
VLIKGGDTLETAHKVKAIVFDKTGTITTGKPVVTDVVPIGKPLNFALRLAASLEVHSEHPIARAIVAHAKDRDVSPLKAHGFSAVPGFGVRGRVGGAQVLLGNRALLLKSGVSVAGAEEQLAELESQGKTVMLLAQGKRVIGLLAVADTIKEHAPRAVAALHALRIDTYMITGDNARAATAIAAQAGIPPQNVFAQVLPQDKAAIVKRLQDSGVRVAMVGDGINDAPALAQADIGIAMGSGTDVAIETGNVVLMRNDLEDVARAIRLSTLTIRKIKQNLFWAFIYNVAGIPVAAGALYSVTGTLLSPVVAGAAMAASSVSVVSNSLLLKTKRL